MCTNYNKKHSIQTSHSTTFIIISKNIRDYHIPKIKTHIDLIHSQPIPCIVIKMLSQSQVVKVVGYNNIYWLR